MFGEKLAIAFTLAALSLASGVEAASLELNEEDLSFCQKETARYADNSGYSNSSRYSRQRSGGARVSVMGFSGGGGGGSSLNRVSHSSGSREVSSQYKARNCDKLLEMKGLVSIAEIQSQVDKHRTDTDFEIVKDNNSTDLITAGIGAGAQLLGQLFNPPSRSAEVMANARIKEAEILARAEVEKERLRLEQSKLAADPLNQTLVALGIQRVDCVPGLVFISGIGDSQQWICTYPTSSLPAGYYEYNRLQHSFIQKIPQVQNAVVPSVSTPVAPRVVVPSVSTPVAPSEETTSLPW
jgi:hypothetical protein